MCRWRQNCPCLTLLFSTHTYDVSAFVPLGSFDNLFSSWGSITVRQTRNPLVGDVQYIASKKVSLPDDPNAFINLGFGKSSEEFAVCCIFIFPQHSLLIWNIVGNFVMDMARPPPPNRRVVSRFDQRDALLWWDTWSNLNCCWSDLTLICDVQPLIKLFLRVERSSG